MKAQLGKVVGNKQANTLIVEVERFFRHRIYEKRIRRTKRYHVHFDGEVKSLGEYVRFIPTRPMSATKRWKLVDEKSTVDGLQSTAKVKTTKKAVVGRRKSESEKK